jgi:hypothetical protein
MCGIQNPTNSLCKFHITICNWLSMQKDQESVRPRAGWILMLPWSNINISYCNLFVFHLVPDGQRAFPFMFPAHEYEMFYFYFPITVNITNHSGGYVCLVSGEWTNRSLNKFAVRKISILNVDQPTTNYHYLSVYALTNEWEIS